MLPTKQVGRSECGELALEPYYHRPTILKKAGQSETNREYLKGIVNRLAHWQVRLPTNSGQFLQNTFSETVHWFWLRIRNGASWRLQPSISDAYRRVIQGQFVMSQVNGSFSGASRQPICPLCRQPVSLESCKTDEDGQAIHEKCYVENVCTHASDEKTFPKTGT
jgi:hypothetical protein